MSARQAAPAAAASEPPASFEDAAFEALVRSWAKHEDIMTPSVPSLVREEWDGLTAKEKAAALLGSAPTLAACRRSRHLGYFTLAHYLRKRLWLMKGAVRDLATGSDADTEHRDPRTEAADHPPERARPAPPPQSGPCGL